MKSKKIPMRSCVITREKLPKGELIRIVKTPDGNVMVDTHGKMNGRGAYIKRDVSVLEKARKSKVLDRILEIEIPDKIYDEVSEIINNN